MRRIVAHTGARAQDEWTPAGPGRTGELDPVALRMAHQLKNPLSAVKALVQLGLRNPAESASHERLAVLEREVDRMQEILTSYLSSARPPEERARARVQLGPLASETLVVLSAQAEGARVRLSSRGDGCVEGDAPRLREALLNLVANAIQATAPGGEVAVEVRPAGDQVEIVVRDTGTGMPPETLRRIGTPFFTTRRQGTGLGVALARSTIGEHGGALRYRSEPGKGTRATVTLPRAAGSIR